LVQTNTDKPPSKADVQISEQIQGDLDAILHKVEASLGTLPGLEKDNTSSDAAVFKLIGFAAQPATYRYYMNSLFSFLFLSDEDAQDISHLNDMDMLAKIIHPSEYDEFFHHFMYHRLTMPHEAYHGDRQYGTGYSWSVCVHCVDRLSRVFPAVVKIRTCHGFGEKAMKLPKTYAGYGVVVSVEPLADCKLTRSSLSLPPPTQAAVFESFKKVMQASQGGIPRAESQNLNIGPDGVWPDEERGEKGKTALREIMVELKRCVDAGVKPEAKVFNQLKSIFWSKLSYLATQRSDVADVVFSTGLPKVPVPDMLPKDHMEKVDPLQDLISRSSETKRKQPSQKKHAGASEGSACVQKQDQSPTAQDGAFQSGGSQRRSAIQMLNASDAAGAFSVLNSSVPKGSGDDDPYSRSVAADMAMKQMEFHANRQLYKIEIPVPIPVPEPDGHEWENSSCGDETALFLDMIDFNMGDIELLESSELVD